MDKICSKSTDSDLNSDILATADVDLDKVSEDASKENQNLLVLASDQLTSQYASGSISSDLSTTTKLTQDKGSDNNAGPSCMAQGALEGVDKSPSTNTNLKDMFREILLRRIATPLSHMSEMSPAPDSPSLSGKGIDIPEADTSKHLQSNLEQNVLSSTSSNETKTFALIEPSESNISKYDPGVAESISADLESDQLPECSNLSNSSSRDYGIEMPDNPEDFSAIEDALRSIISDVEQTNFEAMSIESDAAKMDLFNGKMDDSSSSMLDLQPDSFLVSSTSVDANIFLQDSRSVVPQGESATTSEVHINKEEITGSEMDAITSLTSEGDHADSLSPYDTDLLNSPNPVIVDSKPPILKSVLSGEKSVEEFNLSSPLLDEMSTSVAPQPDSVKDETDHSPQHKAVERDIQNLVKELCSSHYPAESNVYKDPDHLTAGVTEAPSSINCQSPQDFFTAHDNKLPESANLNFSEEKSISQTFPYSETIEDIEGSNELPIVGSPEGPDNSKMDELQIEKIDLPLSQLVAGDSLTVEEGVVESDVVEAPLLQTVVPFTESSKSVSETIPIEIDEPDSSAVASVCSGENTDSLAATPCDSGATSPLLYTPADSCQASAAASPLAKPLEEDPNLIPNLNDDNSLEAKFIEEDSNDITPKGLRKISLVKKGIKRKAGPVIMDEETRMDAGSNGISDIIMDEDSQGSIGTINKKKVRSFRCEVIVPESTEIFTVEKVAEYMWPLEGIGEHYFIQEHISQYLGIMSFKRRYPDLRRRPIESQEKEYLKENGFVNEMACDLGLTAVRSEDVFDVMFNDFPTKYEELQKDLRDRKELKLKEKGKVEYQLVNLDKSKLQEYGRKAAADAARWNIALNKDRKEERRYAFDLQTFTLHKPIGFSRKLPEELTSVGFYPVAVLPGQYTDHCKQYATEELRSMPLQTILSGPFTAEELSADLQKPASDEESAPASVGTSSNEKEGTEKEVVVLSESLPAEKQPQCKECNGTRDKNKDDKQEPLIVCGSCRTPSHPTCIDLTMSMIKKIESYSWQCMECKTCAQCNDPDDEERMIFCDMCDRGYHIYCVGLRRVPQGRWHCKVCAICFSCGSRTPSANEHIKNAEWQHEYKKEKDNKQLKYACTLCMPCDKYWKRRQFCYVCMKVYRSIPEDGMVKCTGCPKYVHREGCSTLHDNERYCTNCFKTRNKTALNHSRIIAAAKKKMASGY